jgi:ribonuclease HIII
MTEEERSGWIGTDESGKGDYFGPLVAAAVYLTPELAADFSSSGVKDSKKLSDSRVASLSSLIKKKAPHSVVVIGPRRYNELYERIKNLNRLLAWAHARAIENLLLEDVPAERAVSDQFGDVAYIESALLKKGRTISLEQRHKAEDDPAVAAASILARAEFLRRLSNLSEKYAIELPKGASEKVIDAGLEFISRHGKEALSEVAKLHFKITNFILKEKKDKR